MDRVKLEMDFLDQVGKRFRLAMDNPREDIEANEVEAAMTSIINQNIFESNDGDLVSIEGARVITTSVEEMEF